MLNKKKRKSATKCNFSISVSKEARLKADQLGQKFDRPRSKVFEMAVNSFHAQNKS